MQIVLITLIEEQHDWRTTQRAVQQYEMRLIQSGFLIIEHPGDHLTPHITCIFVRQPLLTVPPITHIGTSNARNKA